MFVDGENIVFRYQEMLLSEIVPNSDIIHYKDIFLWHPNLTKQTWHNLIRVNYYTSMVASEENICEMKEKISNIRYDFAIKGKEGGSAQICPYIFKKAKSSQKSRNVDIQICIDIMRSVCCNQADLIIIVSGDGDYLPLIQEIMRHGKQVYVYALSSGLFPSLKYTPDDFMCIDNIFKK